MVKALGKRDTQGCGAERKDYLTHAAGVVRAPGMYRLGCRELGRQEDSGSGGLGLCLPGSELAGPHRLRPPALGLALTGAGQLPGRRCRVHKRNWVGGNGDQEITLCGFQASTWAWLWGGSCSSTELCLGLTLPPFSHGSKFC